MDNERVKQLQGNLAEKPDMGRNIADALGEAKSNRGYIELIKGGCRHLGARSYRLMRTSVQGMAA